MPPLTWEEARDIGTLDTLVPLGLYAADLAPGAAGLLLRQQLASEFVVKVLGHGLGDAIGPNGTPTLDQAHEIPWIQSTIGLNVARYGPPNRKRS